MPVKTLGVAFCAALTSVLALTSCTSSSTAAKVAKPVTMADCNGQHHARPDLIQVICASDAITARNLTWTKWGKPIATATGAAVVNWCAFEGCAQGEYDSYKVVMIASKLRQCPHDREQYARLQYVFVGDEDPFDSLPKNVGTSGLFFGGHGPDAPREPVVSLSC
jgi:hypothetical protein